MSSNWIKGNFLKRRVRPIELYAALAGIAMLATFAYATGHFTRQFVPSEARSVKLVPESNPYGFAEKNSTTLFNLNAFFNEAPPVFAVSIEPELVVSLDAALPKEQTCKKIRYKKAPVDSISVNGVPVSGENWMRYRGYCYPHWLGEQKSVKLNLGTKYRGHKTVNLNAIATDPSLFEIWANQLMTLTGGVASRVGYARLYVNGKYEGLRFLVENLDKHLLKDQSLKKGGIYREINAAFIGHRPVAERGDYAPYESINQVKETWKKNSDKSQTWEPFFEFNRAVMDSVLNGGDSWKNLVNIDHYINYIALQVITGTNHQNNHNIPIYQPRREVLDESSAPDMGRIIPVGYDFGSMYSTSFDSNFTEPNVQLYSVSQNWLTSLFWADVDLRGRIHRRVVEILNSHSPSALYGRIARRSNQLFANENSFAKIAANTASLQKVIDRRVAFLEDGFYHPTASISPDWSGKDRFQMMIDGLGRYDINLSIPEQACQSDTYRPVVVTVNLIEKKPVTACEKGWVATKPFAVERNWLHRDRIKQYFSYIWRQPLGPILLTFDNVGADLTEIKEILVEPLSVSGRLGNKVRKAFEPKPDWPFFIERGDEGQIDLGTPDANDATRLRFYNLNDGDLQFEMSDGQLNVSTFNIDSRAYFTQFGPIACWTISERDGCYEFTEAELFPSRQRTKRTGPKTAEEPSGTKADATLVSAHTAAACAEKYSFGPGKWEINEGVVFPKACSVSFDGEAVIEFSSNAYMIVLGKVAFASKGETRFIGRDSTEWGGVVFHGQDRLDISNVYVANGTEFLWEGTGYTGAFNVTDVGETTVRRSRFVDNDADDGLNIRGGKVLVTENTFIRNRDGLDLDLATGLVKNNVFVDQFDDGVDFGTARDVTLEANVIFNSGDKGISVGEGSSIIIKNNVIARNNFGVANKDGSQAEVSGNSFYRNAIAVSAYNKRDRDGAVVGVSGDSRFLDNASVYKIDDKGITEADHNRLKVNMLSRELLQEHTEGILAHSVCGRCIYELSVDRVIE